MEEDELRQFSLEIGSEELRRVRLLAQGVCDRPQVRRLVRPSRRRLVNEWADWLQEFPLRVFVTATWSDEGADLHWVHSDRGAVKDFEYFLNRELGFEGQYFGVVEDHMHRDVPHIHALLEDRMDWTFAWHEWYKSRGLFRSCKAEGGAFAYVAKYLLKDGRCGNRVFERLSDVCRI